MIGSWKKTYDIPIIVDGIKLQHLVDMIRSNYPVISYSIKTVDGAEYMLSSIEDILDYANPGNRRIKQITIVGNKERFPNRFISDISIDLFDMTIYDKSCIVLLKEVNEQSISYYSQRIDEFIESAKVRYGWVHKPSFILLSALIIMFVLFIMLCFIFPVGFREMTKNQVSVFLLSFFFTGASAQLMNRLVKFFFSQGGFSFGEQVSVLQNKEKRRNVLLIVILLPILLGVIAGLLTHLIIS